MPVPNPLDEVLTFMHTAGALSLLLQTPPPTITPQPGPLELTQAQVPYIILVTVAVLAFVFGGLLRPLIEDLGSALLRRIKRLGKAGDFRDHYLTYVIRQNRHLPMLPANVVIARWVYQRQAMELEELYTPLSLGSEGRDPDEMQMQRSLGRRRPTHWLQRQWWRIRPPVGPTAGDVGAMIVAQPRLVVRGDPGSGKSTMLRYLALTAARSLRGNRRDGDDRTLVRRRLGWKQRPLPLLVNLSLLSDV